jgi:hypothetical protein
MGIQMATRASLMAGTFLLGLVAADGATGAGMTVQASTCIHDAELRLRSDGTVYACHVLQQINASVGPEAKNRNVVCAAGSYVEFHYNGHLSYCDKLAKAGSYLSRGGESKICKQQEPISFNESGDLEYCS